MIQPWVIYTKKVCGWCDRAKAILERSGIQYQAIIVGEGISRDAFIQLLPADKRAYPTVPQIWDGSGNYIGNYEALIEFIDNHIN
jgi:glutaredoxin 3